MCTALMALASFQKVQVASVIIMLLASSAIEVTGVPLCIFRKVKENACQCHYSTCFPSQGFSNKQVEKAVVEMSEGFVKMPKKGDWVVAIVTAIISATRFYVQLPLGCTSPLSLDDEKLPGTQSLIFSYFIYAAIVVGSEVEKDFSFLLEEMR